MYRGLKTLHGNLISLFLCSKKCFWEFLFLKIIFYIIFLYTNIKNKIFKINKYYFDVFPNKKYFKKQLLRTTIPNTILIMFD
jgi:hypothetical protein